MSQDNSFGTTFERQRFGDDGQRPRSQGHALMAAVTGLRPGTMVAGQPSRNDGLGTAVAGPRPGTVVEGTVLEQRSQDNGLRQRSQGHGRPRSRDGGRRASVEEQRSGDSGRQWSRGLRSEANGHKPTVWGQRSRGNGLGTMSRGHGLGQTAVAGARFGVEVVGQWSGTDVWRQRPRARGLGVTVLGPQSRGNGLRQTSAGQRSGGSGWGTEVARLPPGDSSRRAAALGNCH